MAVHAASSPPVLAVCGVFARGPPSPPSCSRPRTSASSRSRSWKRRRPPTRVAGIPARRRHRSSRTVLVSMPKRSARSFVLNSLVSSIPSSANRHKKRSPVAPGGSASQHYRAPRFPLPSSHRQAPSPPASRSAEGVLTDSPGAAFRRAHYRSLPTQIGANAPRWPGCRRGFAKRPSTSFYTIHRNGSQ